MALMTLGVGYYYIPYGRRYEFMFGASNATGLFGQVGFILGDIFSAAATFAFPRQKLINAATVILAYCRLPFAQSSSYGFAIGGVLLSSDATVCSACQRIIVASLQHAVGMVKSDRQVRIAATRL